MKVLSIDFDYFQKVSASVAMTYPDGHDFCGDLSSQIWSTHYANQDLKNEVKLPNGEVLKMKNIILNQDPAIKGMVSHTHLHIYDFIHENVPLDETLEVVNIDMHHDMFNENPEVDCGNWVSHIMKEYDKASLKWIANRISKSVYGIDQKEQLYKLIETKLDSIKNEKFDLIFLCRSDMWLPPHLDYAFNDLANVVLTRFSHVKYTNVCLKPRYDDVNKWAKEYAEFLKETRKRYNTEKKRREDR